MLNDYILVLGKQSEDIQALKSLLSRLRCSVAVASSADQVVAQASQTLPYLVILSGDRQDWSPNLVKQLRQMARVCGTTIVALTDFHAPSWLHQEENGGVDGYLVKPIEGDVLCSLVQCAWARQSCLHAAVCHS